MIYNHFNIEIENRWDEFPNFQYLFHLDFICQAHR